MQSILQEAELIVNGERAQAYGPVKDSFNRIAQMWSVVLGTTVTAEQVGLMLITMKVARQVNASKRDNLVDIAGYAECIAKLQD